MPVRQKRNSTARGFTLIEVLITIGLLSLLVTTFYVPRLQDDIIDYQRAIASTTADEIYGLATSAQNYAAAHLGSWPDAVNDCVNAITEMQDSGHLAAADDMSPLDRSTMYQATPVNKKDAPFAITASSELHAGKYYTSCPERGGQRQRFELRYILPTQQAGFSERMRAQIPNARIISSEKHAGLIMDVPVPSSVPIVESMLPRDGSRPMTGSLDMAQNVLLDVGDIYMSSGQSMGTKIEEALVVRHGDKIRKPRCLDGYEPNILVTLARVEAQGGALTQASIYAKSTTQGGVDVWEIETKSSSSHDDAQTTNNVGGAIVSCVRT